MKKKVLIISIIVIAVVLTLIWHSKIGIRLRVGLLKDYYQGIAEQIMESDNRLDVSVFSVKKAYYYNRKGAHKTVDFFCFNHFDDYYGFFYSPDDILTSPEGYEFQSIPEGEGFRMPMYGDSEHKSIYVEKIFDNWYYYVNYF